MPAELSGRPLRGTRRDRALFVDREQTIGVAEQALRNGGNVLLVGQRGSGKSSILRIVAHDLEEEGHRRVLLDGRTAASTLDFLVLLRDQLGAWTRVPLREAAANVASVASRVLEAPQVVLRPNPTETQNLLSELREIARNLPTEGETIVIVWELPLVWLVAVDERDVGLYREPPADAFWQRVVTIPDLDPDAAAELLRRRLEDDQLPADVLQQLVAAAEGNPRRLIALAYDIVVEGAEPAALMLRDQDVRDRIKDLGEPAKRLLAEVEANGAASPSDEGLLRKLGWTRGRASQVFRELEEQGLVRALERPGSGGRPRRLYEVTY